MNTNTLVSWPFVSPENSMTTSYSSKSRRQNMGMVKRMTVPAPPDDETIRKMNELASTHPFCALHKVKKHDTL